MDMPVMERTNHTVIESASIEIVQRVSAASGQDERILPPLYETIDPDALDTLIASVSSPTELGSFTYLDFTTTVIQTGTVTIKSAPA